MKKVVGIFVFFHLFFLFQTIYAQKMVLEYFDGREIVVYTPDYKLLLLEELNPGDEIPVGSIIETGRKSSCELRLSGDGTIIKVGDRSTFKIQQLIGPDGQGRNEFKLLGGAMRAVTEAKAGFKQYIFSSGASIVYPDAADFGLTVKKGWEEKVFVLAGKVLYINSRGNEEFVYAEQMANGLDEILEPDSMSVRMKRIANSLAFSHLHPGDVENTSEENPYNRTASPTIKPAVTPQATDDRIIVPTPGPIITSEPTPGPSEELYDGSTPEPADTPEKSSASYVPSRGELYPEDEYAYNAIYKYPFNYQVDEVNDNYVIIFFDPTEDDEPASSDEETGEDGKTEKEKKKKKKGTVELPEYTLFEVYNVYEKKDTLSGKDVYSGFVDSVFLDKVENNAFYFSFLWDGSKKEIKPGFFLYPTGRIYSKEEDKIIVIKKNEESGEGEETIVEEELEFSDDSSGKSKKSKSYEGPPPPVDFIVDAGLSINMGFFNVETGLGGDADFLFQMFMLLASLRARYFMDATLKFGGWFGLGIEASVGVMYATVNDIDVYYIDFPLRGFLRFGSKDLYIEPYCGYYFSFAIPEGGEFQGSGIDGLEFGTAVSLAGFYLEGSYVYGEMAGQLNYIRAGIGFVINDLF